MRGLTAVIFTVTFLSFIGAAGAEDEVNAAIRSNVLELTCKDGKGSGGKWNSATSSATTYLIEKSSDSAKLEPTCQLPGALYTFYVKAKVCPHCVDMDTVTVAGIIVADLLITLGVAMTVYYCTKNRLAKGRGRSKGYKGGIDQQRPPPIPNPDYEPIRQNKRDIYSGLNTPKKLAAA